MSNQPWWRGAVIYQVYPRSFMDTNADGIGDIPGIIEKIDYVASLGVDAIWISPFFKSPMKDFGYDIADYRDIDPMFGTLDDFDRLIEEAHKRDIKIIIDQVLSHTSDEHLWFQESRESRHNPRADWYVWADARADGTPPNNWLSIFGGSAWEWEPRRGQYYLHNFLKSQPDLNFHNREVQLQILEEVEFWLKRGVDGLRLDAINFCFHDKLLRNNPAKEQGSKKVTGFREDNPYARQWHTFNNTQPENLPFLEELRALIDAYPGAVTLGEVSSDDSLATMAEYTDGDRRLHMAYSFDLLTEDFSADYIRSTVSTLERCLQSGWPCWSIGNHDVERVVSRWGREHAADEHTRDRLAKVLSAMLMSLRGTMFCYQGEELGLVEAELTFEQLQDPYGITFWPVFKGRDGCRTPLAWSSDPHGGFTEGDPWLPVFDAHIERAVSVQDDRSDSVLNAFRRFAHWRRSQPALRYGTLAFLEAQEPLLAFTRSFEGETLVAVFNLSPQAQTWELPGLVCEALDGHGLAGSLAGGKVELPGFSGYIGRQKNDE